MSARDHEPDYGIWRHGRNELGIPGLQEVVADASGDPEKALKAFLETEPESGRYVAITERGERSAPYMQGENLDLLFPRLADFKTLQALERGEAPALRREARELGAQLEQAGREEAGRISRAKRPGRKGR